MRLIDLSGQFAKFVKRSHNTIEFKAAFWGWLERQRRRGPLAPLLEDMERHWASIGEGMSLSEARDVLRRLSPHGYARRGIEIGERFRAVTGSLPEVEVLLLAGLERPEGYSRFERGRNTIFIGLDHPTALAHPDHLEIILSHELCHAVRDPHPAVLHDYMGDPEMTHDEFVARHPFREHLVSEALACAVAERCYPGRPQRRYVFFAEEADRWADEHRREIAERMLLALEREEPYRTFYAEGSVTPDSPDCCDYWFGLHLGRYALDRAPAGELLRLSSTELLARFLEPFVDDFLAHARAPVLPPPAPPADLPGRATGQRIVLPVGSEPLEAASLPPTVRGVYDEYAALLGRRTALAQQLDEQLLEKLHEAGLEHGGEPWHVHAFPLLLSAEEERHLRWATDGLLRLIEQVIELYREDGEVRAFFGFPRPIEELCLLDPGFRPHVMLGRFDSYWSGRRVRYLELNVNGAALWPVAELLGEEVLELPGLGELLTEHAAESWPLASRMYDGLLSAWTQLRGPEARPRRIAILDWHGVATSSEQRRLAEHFTCMGIPCERVDPRQLTYDGAELRTAEGPIDLIYRRLTTNDLIEHADELGPFLDAARAGRVVTVSSFASDVAHSKRLFAFLTHERWQRQLSPAERALIDAHVPWTRMFVPGKTQFEGRRCDVRELALGERERFVLKPAEGYEGRGVLLGVATDPAEWRAEVERRYGGPHVIQEMVPAPLRNLLLARGKRVEEVARWLHLGEFVIAGQLAGFLARTSEDLVLSADVDERTLPCLVLADDAGTGHDRDLGPATP